MNPGTTQLSRIATRRRLLAAISVILVAPPTTALSARLPRVAWIGRSEGLQSVSFKAFASGLRDAGYVIGENVLVDVRTPERDKVEQYPTVAARVVADGVDVILASNPYAIAAVTRATRTVPVVAVDFESDPVAKGWVTSLAHPGGNLTGFFLDIPEISGKQLQILKEIKQDLAKVAVLGDPRVNELQFRAAEAAASAAALALQKLPISGLDEIPGALAHAADSGAGALLVLSSPMVFPAAPRIAEAAIKYALPSICLFVPSFAEAGGLFAYGPALVEPFRRAASYVDRILKGASPARLPVQRPTKFELVINLRTAKALSLTMPPALRVRADHVIE